MRWRTETALPARADRPPGLVLRPGAEPVGGSAGAPDSARAALRAVGRGGGRALVGRADRRPARRGRVQPGRSTAAPLAQDAEILGFPLVEIARQRGADAAALVRPAMRRGAGRHGHPGDRRRPGRRGRTRCATRPLPGRPHPAVPASLPLELHVTSWVFPRGHRIRLAVSNAMWPMIWPTPLPGDGHGCGSGRTGRGWCCRWCPHPAAAAGAGVRRAGPGGAAAGVRQPGATCSRCAGPCSGTTPVPPRSGGAAAPAPSSPGAGWWTRSTCGTRSRRHGPAAASAHGEARTEFHLDGRLLIATSVLDLDGDEESLRYSYRRELRRDGDAHPRAQLGAPLPARRPLRPAPTRTAAGGGGPGQAVQSSTGPRDRTNDDPGSIRRAVLRRVTAAGEAHWAATPIRWDRSAIFWVRGRRRRS